jgi:hypothetical protein
MNVKDFVFGVLVTLTLVFASVSVIEYYQVSDLNAQLQSRTVVVTQQPTPNSTPELTSQASITQYENPYYVYVTQTVAATTVTEYVTAAYGSPWYAEPNATIPVSAPGVFPAKFTVGSYLGPEYVFGFTLVQSPPQPCYCPPDATCDCTTTYDVYGTYGVQQLDFLVSQRGVYSPPSPEWANFTWTSWSTLPSPSSTTLFGGNVTMQWFVNSSWLSLNIAVK